MKTIVIIVVLEIFLMPTASIGQNQSDNQQSNSRTNQPDFTNVPTLEWKFRVGEPFISSPVIEGETVYVGCLDSNLYALDVKHGMVRWKFKTNGPIRSTVSIVNSQLFLVSGDGSLYSIDKTTGKIIWVFKTKGEKQYDIFDYYQSSPLCENGAVYFGSGDGNVYAIDQSNGKKLWSFPTGNVVHSTPAISNGKLFVGSFDGYVYALGVLNGNLIWKFKSIGHDYFHRGEMQFSPAVVNGRVYIGGRDYNIYALDADSGFSHWNREFPAGWAPVITPSGKNDSIIYVGTSDPLLLLAINGVTENTLWKTDVKSNIFGKCALSQSMCYTGTLIGKLFGIDISTGKIQWTFTTDGYNANHLLYFKPDDSYRDDILTILKTNEEFIKAQYRMGAIYSTPAIFNDIMILSTTEGTVYCLRRE
jgi:outer membrane protein assembly factor BamB